MIKISYIVAIGLLLTGNINAMDDGDIGYMVIVDKNVSSLVDGFTDNLKKLKRIQDANEGHERSIAESIQMSTEDAKKYIELSERNRDLWISDDHDYEELTSINKQMYDIWEKYASNESKLKTGKPIIPSLVTYPYYLFALQNPDSVIVQKVQANITKQGLTVSDQLRCTYEFKKITQGSDAVFVDVEPKWEKEGVVDLINITFRQ